MLFLHVVVEGAVRLEAFVTNLADLRLLLHMVTAGRSLAWTGTSAHLDGLGQLRQRGQEVACLHVLLERLDTLAHLTTLGAEETHQLGAGRGRGASNRGDRVLADRLLLITGVVDGCMGEEGGWHEKSRRKTLFNSYRITLQEWYFYASTIYKIGT